MSPAQAASSGAPARREHILDCAAKLFADRGYDATSLGDLADASGIAKATLFHYFKTKQQILFELYDRALRYAQDRISAVDDPVGDSEEVLRSMVREHALLIMREQRLYTLFFAEENSLDPETREAVRARQAEYLTQIGRRVIDLQKNGRVAADISPIIAVQTMLGAGSFTHKWFSSDREAPDTVIAKFIADIAVAGLLAHPGLT
jgi:AcrR family transcriptional regulator